MWPSDYQSRLDYDAHRVLLAFPDRLRSGQALRLVKQHGFSGASIFQVDSASGSFCLRAWPARESQPERLVWLHRLVAEARDSGLSFVPRLFATIAGDTMVQQGGRLWELQEWLPGRADFHDRPGPARLENACIALAQLHSKWQGNGSGVSQTCPAVQRRLEGLRSWQGFALTATEPGMHANLRPSLQAVVVTARNILPYWLGQVGPWLEQWKRGTFQLQPCLCDVWHDHLLFDGDNVTGIIDYGAVKMDHPAVDAARMLGSLVEDEDAAWQRGLAAYRSVRGFSTEEERLARALDVTGTVLGLANWRQRIGENRPGEEQEAVARRMETLVRRLERWEKHRPLATLHI